VILFDFLVRLFFWGELFLPLFVCLYFFYCLGDYFLSFFRPAYVKPAKRVYEKPAKKTTKKFSAEVVDSYSEAFKLSLPDFDD